jgi:hypothetical protein
VKKAVFWLEKMLICFIPFDSSFSLHYELSLLCMSPFRCPSLLSNALTKYVVRYFVKNTRKWLKWSHNVIGWRSFLKNVVYWVVWVVELFEGMIVPSLLVVLIASSLHEFIHVGALYCTLCTDRCWFDGDLPFV